MIQPVIRVPLFLGMLLLSIIARADTPGGDLVQNRKPLAPRALLPLPLGSIEARGWLLTQLELQRDGLSGYAEEKLPQLGPDSSWLGGHPKEDKGGERAPYYVKGLVPLAYTLKDPALEAKARKWIEWSLKSARPDGNFGPDFNDEWWPRMIMTYAMRDYYEATGDQRVIRVMNGYVRYLANNLPKDPLTKWGKARAGDLIDTLIWLYNRTGNRSILPVVDLLHQQAYDWTGIYTNDTFHQFGEDYYPKHNVNVCQALKMPAIYWQRSRDKADAAAYRIGMTHLLRGNGQPVGTPVGTEFLAGRSAIEGVELCSIVEEMLSQETVISILGDASVGDDLERVTYNALPAALSKNIKQYQYFSPTNEVIAVTGGQGFTQDYQDEFTPGPVSGFPCCCYNFHMGWPKFVQSSWMGTRDGGAALVAYGPTVAHFPVAEGAILTIEEKTDYPFRDLVSLELKLDKPATFPLELRIPAWCAAPMVSVNGEVQSSIAAGQFARISRAWKSGDEVEIKLPMTSKITTGYANQSVSVEHGPLVYVLKIKQQKDVLKPDADGFVKYQIEPNSPWNYALAVDPANPDASISFSERPMPKNPFEPDVTPDVLNVKAKQLKRWTLDYNGRAALDPPTSPVQSNQPEESVTLIPYGASSLRVATFPILGSPPPAVKEFTDTFDEDEPINWVNYGGGWYVKNHTLWSAASGGHSHGADGVNVKAVAGGTLFGNFTYDADIIPGPIGTTGLLFRIHGAAIGANSFDGYYAAVDPTRQKLEYGKSVDNKWILLGSQPVHVPTGKLHMKVVALGSIFKISLGDDSEPAATFNDSTYASGAIGVREDCADPKTTIAGFANISVTAD